MFKLFYICLLSDRFFVRRESVKFFLSSWVVSGQVVSFYVAYIIVTVTAPLNFFILYDIISILLYNVF